MDQIDSLLRWDVDVANLADLRDRLKRRPEYPGAARRLSANMLRDAERDPSLDGLLKDVGRTVAGLSAAYLSASSDITLARLKTFIAGFGLVSPGRARSLLSLMRHLGYVEPIPANPPTRSDAYRLTPRFLAAYTQHEASILDAVQLIEPAAGLVLRDLHRREVFNTLVVQQGDAFVAGRQQPQLQPYQAWYDVFLHPQAGIQALHTLVAAAGAFPPTEAITLPRAAMARQLKVSRVHLNRMLQAARQHDFVAPDPSGVRFTDKGRQALDWHYASRFCVHLACVARTLKAHPELAKRNAA